MISAAESKNIKSPKVANILYAGKSLWMSNEIHP